MKYFCLSLSLLLLKFTLFGQNIEFRGNVTYNQTLSDIWGWSDGESEFAIVGYERGFSIVDVTDPDNPEKLFNESGPRTIWRDIKTWGNYAYGIHENAGSSGVGLAIMDLSGLPGEFNVTYWKNDGTLEDDYLSSHNIFIDEKGFAYIVGGNEVTGGVLILDLNEDPENPTVAGMYRERYVHDCFARNDTLWVGEVYNGEFSVIDVSNKAFPAVLARQETPFEFTHNIWVSDDGKTAFTTDETGGAPVAAYDVSDLDDIRLIDEFKSGNGVIPHNAHVINDYVVVSYYRDGVVVVDASYPDEMVMTGFYDTAPSYSGNGFNGCWGVFPYLPSGNIIASDMETGLHVLTPDYTRAFHIRGTVSDAYNGAIIPQAAVRIDNNNGYANFDGFFKKGYAEAATVEIEISKDGYVSQLLTVSGVNGDVVELDIVLERIVYAITDTIYANVQAETSITVCDENTGGIFVDNALACVIETSSTYGSWEIGNDNCLHYTANNQNGEFVDSICYLVENSNSGEQNINVVIVSISGAPTAVINNAFDDGGLALLQNPVTDQLILRNSINVRAPMHFKVYDMNGKLIDQKNNIEAASSVSLNVEHLSRGMFILSVSTGDEYLGNAKFIKE